jgi:4-hydroxythreonine-4-phosphate dehydrogenase
MRQMSMKINRDKIRVGITMGDPSGIGPAIICQALNKLAGQAEFVVIGDKRVFHKAARMLGQKIPDSAFIDLNNIRHNLFGFGKVRAEFGRASIEYLDTALELIGNNRIDCLVTAPISKAAIKLAGLPFRGHTEYLAKRTNAKNPVMMLLNERLRFSLVTRHIPLKQVPQALNRQKLTATIALTRQFLRKYFLIRCPRILVCGLNPHASDNGLIGKEENQIIKPVIKRLSKKIKFLSGPLPADVAVYQASQGNQDCLIALYHDQALIPLKLSGADTGVNITLGLPFVRTSPLHGTAFDISNKPSLANPASLISAIQLAILCVSNQRKA